MGINFVNSFNLKWVSFLFGTILLLNAFPVRHGCSIQRKRRGDNVTLLFHATTVNSEDPALLVANVIKSPNDSTLLNVRYRNGNPVNTPECNGCTFIGDAKTGNLTIRLDNLQASYGGTYKLEVGGKEILEKCIALFILDIPTKPSIKSNKDPLVGESVALTCSSTSRTTPSNHGLTLTYNWIVDGKENPSDARYSYSTKRKTLTMSNVVKTDASKQFTCTATEDVNEGYTSDSSNSFSPNVLSKKLSETIVLFSNMADLERRLRRIRRRIRPERVFRDRQNPLEVLSEEELFCRYTFCPESIMILVGMVFNDLERATSRSVPLPPLLSVLVTLQFFASGAHYILIGDIHSICQSSVCRAVRSTTKAICRLVDRFVRLPHDLAQTQLEFYNIARFPKVIGVIDGTQIRIRAPSLNEPDYVNRKGFHSINVQMVCNAKLIITNVVAKWPGSVHDSRIFRESSLCAELEQGNIDGYLLGDSGYPCRPYLMTPYLNPSTPGQESYNKSLTRTRVLIEQCFGVLKRRFACLSYGLRMVPGRCCEAVIACVVLHNFGQLRGDTIGRIPDVNLPPPDADAALDLGGNGLQQRDIVAATYFH